MAICIWVISIFLHEKRELFLKLSQAFVFKPNSISFAQNFSRPRIISNNQVCKSDILKSNEAIDVKFSEIVRNISLNCMN